MISQGVSLPFQLLLTDSRPSASPIYGFYIGILFIYGYIRPSASFPAPTDSQQGPTILKIYVSYLDNGFERFSPKIDIMWTTIWI